MGEADARPVHARGPGPRTGVHNVLFEDPLDKTSRV